MSNSQIVLDGYIVSWVDEDGVTSVTMTGITIDDARSLATSVVDRSLGVVIILGLDGYCYDW